MVAARENSLGTLQAVALVTAIVVAFLAISTALLAFGAIEVWIAIALYMGMIALAKTISAVLRRVVGDH